jgi:hypothetical protein
MGASTIAALGYQSSNGKGLYHDPLSARLISTCACAVLRTPLDCCLRGVEIAEGDFFGDGPIGREWMERREFLRGATAVGLGAVLADAASSSGLVSPTAAGSGRSSPSPAPIGQHERILLDTGWRFHRGDVVVRPPHTHSETYDSTKAGAAAGAAGIKFDDTAWRVLDLPHDFVVEGPFSEAENGGQGYRPKGIAWYRKELTFDAADRGKHLELQFDGIATNATIWFNGNVVCHNWSAYNSAYIDVTAFAHHDANQMCWPCASMRIRCRVGGTKAVASIAMSGW